jgi:hypothetical protein
LKYVRVVEWSVEGDTIKLEMLGDDDATHTLEVGRECAGALAGALAAETAKVDAEGNEHQFIRPTGMQTGKTAQGEPMLFMSLKGGVELPLVFKAEALPVLISELEKLRSILEPGSQIRWN